MEGQLHLVDLITNEYICNHGHPNFIMPHFTNEAIGAIKFYLHPYLEEIETITNFDFINIINKYPEQLKGEILTSPFPFTQKDYDDGKYKSYTQREVKIFIMDTIFYYTVIDDNDEILNEDSPEETKEISITVWDILKRFNYDEFPRQFFNLTHLANKGKVNANIDVTIGNNKFIHPMSYNLVLGILTFYKAYGLQHPLSCYGGIFSDILINPIITNKDYIYTIELNGNMYGFYDIEFMQGLITAAQWNNMDPYKYIINLKQYLKPSSEILSLKF